MVVSSVTDPLDIIERCLDAQARGEPYDEDELIKAATLVVGRQFVEWGLEPDLVAEMLTERDHAFNFSRDAEKLVVTVRWLDEDD